MIFAAGESRQAQITLQWNDFRFAWATRKAEPACEEAFIHDAIGTEIRITGFTGNHGIKVARISQSTAHQLCVGEGVAPFSEGNRTRIAKQADFRHFVAM